MAKNSGLFQIKALSLLPSCQKIAGPRGHPQGALPHPRARQSLLTVTLQGPEQKATADPSPRPERAGITPRGLPEG